jgi:hypothetical protein
MFCMVSYGSMRFHEVSWDSMRFYNVSVNQSVPTEANRGLTSHRRTEENTHTPPIITNLSEPHYLTAGSFSNIILFVTVVSVVNS